MSPSFTITDPFTWKAMLTNLKIILISLLVSSFISFNSHNECFFVNFPNSMNFAQQCKVCCQVSFLELKTLIGIRANQIKSNRIFKSLQWKVIDRNSNNKFNLITHVLCWKFSYKKFRHIRHFSNFN